MPSAITADAARALASILSDAARAEILDRVVLSKPHDPSIVRVTLSLRTVKGAPVLQAETLRAAEVAEVKGKKKPVQASHENLPADETLDARLPALIAAHDQINVFTSAGACEFKRARGGKEVLLGAQPIRAALDGAAPATPKKLPLSGNDHVKNRVLRGDEPFLIRLEVSDGNGRVHDKKQSKFRQINRFLELIRDVESRLPAEGTLHICDLCCGKSYLSFAVYHYFTAVRRRTVHMVGVDMKADVMDECNAIARDLRMDGLSFVCADVSKYAFDTAGEPVHMVISLHACDTATDLVLDKAIEWGAKLILSTPCCHHELNRLLDCPELSFIADHSMLRQKLCDAATDALRLKRLEANGYEVAALELIDPEETPKNVMLRGIRTYDPSAPRCRKAADEYEAARRFLIRGE